MKKPSMLRSTAVLGLVCLVAAALLGTAYVLTEQKIEEQQEIILQQNLKQVLPEAERFEEKDDYYVATNDGEIVGYAALSTGSGYGGPITVLVGIDLENTITGVRIMKQTETPGLGANAVNPEFYSQFNNITQEEVKLARDGGRIDAITGATITTDAIIDAVRQALAERIR